MTQKIEQWMRGAAEEMWDTSLILGCEKERVMAIIASHAPSEAVWSQCPRCNNGIYNGKECAICYGTGRVTESLLAREAAAKPPIDDISVICAEIEHNDH